MGLFVNVYNIYLHTFFIYCEIDCTERTVINGVNQVFFKEIFFKIFYKNCFFIEYKKACKQLNSEIFIIREILTYKIHCSCNRQNSLVTSLKYIKVESLTISIVKKTYLTLDYYNHNLLSCMVQILFL